eukprot:CAMPEP_0203824164 /NCGR_PEP_ID=MMETSP0115-20131106/51142_1 /ASSEMBLY_ACC=CAM_ASM_000227 /TAXON_ID=33651 /ORGANISM="Bicosoecid sp, Strain ms1" /LENGTH=35 /DNA_ID= /DNA_START= /DNA_END= /DNA_ORIENTATION=
MGSGTPTSSGNPPRAMTWLLKLIERARLPPAAAAA